MRPGPPRGETTELTITVSESMTDPSSGPIPPTYGLDAMVVHMGQVSQQILAPHLEPGEIGIGDKADIDRRIPVTIGASVRLIASVAKVGPQELVCEVLLRSGGLLIARGSCTLRVVDAASFARDIQTPA